MSSIFNLVSGYSPSEDQQRVIDELTDGSVSGHEAQVLMGVTGSGKTFTMANIIRNLSRPTLIMTHNKTLSAQLYKEFCGYFPDNAVEYFVSYYDYYQPEAYVPAKDLFIDKETSINDDLDKLRLSATRSLFEREDVVIISSVSCIYGLGSPEAYSGMVLYLKQGETYDRRELFKKLIEIQYKRNDFDFHRGTYRVRGECLDIYPAYADSAVRVEMFGDEIERIYEIDPLTGIKVVELSKYALYPASHYVQLPHMMDKTLQMIEAELADRLQTFKTQGKLLEAQRIEQRTRFDMEILEETGTCNGVENYSRIMTRRKTGAPPPTLIDYFPKSSLLFLDESHVTLPQVRGMFHGDLSRKTTLIEHGFRLPSALDNRPLQFSEFERAIGRVIYVSATPGDFEMEKAQNRITEQIIRPTYILDPTIEIYPVMGQVDHLYEEILKRTKQNERILITTLTKKMSEDLTDHYKDLDLRVNYMHSDINTIERTEILRDLRLGKFDALIGINLLREGLDLPEVSLVAIFDADKEGFLRSYRSLIQTFGRAARNVNGMVYLYADRVTDSMKKAIDETNRRRQIQIKYNADHGKIPKTIIKSIQTQMVADAPAEPLIAAEKSAGYGVGNPEKIQAEINRLTNDMKRAAQQLKFENAAKIRDEIKYWKEFLLGIVE